MSDQRVCCRARLRAMLDAMPRRHLLALALLSVAAAATLRAQGPAWIEAYRAPVARILAAATADQSAWDRLAEVTDTFGHRLSGSQALEDAIEWAAARMREDGFDEVRLPKPVFLGDTLRFESEVMALRESKSRPDSGIVTWEHRATNQRGEIVCTMNRSALIRKNSS